MSKTYPILDEGEWFELPRKDFRFQCCSCGLIHVINSKLVPNGKGGTSVQLQMFRDNRGTGQVQRHMRTRTSRVRLPDQKSLQPDPATIRKKGK